MGSGGGVTQREGGTLLRHAHAINGLHTGAIHLPLLRLGRQEARQMNLRWDGIICAFVEDDQVGLSAVGRNTRRDGQQG